MANRSGSSATRMGTPGTAGDEQLALQAWVLRCAAGTSMDATVDRSSEAEGRKFVNDATQVGIKEGYDRWAPAYDHTINPVLALEERYITPLLGTFEGRAVL